MQVTQVPFAQLVAADAINARPITKDGIDELAASIETSGLIQPLAVRPADGGKFEVIDGRRRFQAMHRLVKARTWRKDALVPVLVRNEDDAGALELSLVANIVRLPMHPVDQHEVFARLEEQGRTPAEIATRFGIEKRLVMQRLALGKLAPEIRKAWRAGKLDDDAAKMFADVARHDVQLAVFEQVKRKGTVQTWEVRQALQKDRVPVDGADPEVLESYLARGGTITESLFDADRFFDDAPLLQTVAREIAAARIEALKADGWSWAALSSSLPSNWSWHWQRLHQGEEAPYTDAERARLDEIDAAHQAGDCPELDAEADRIEAAAELRRFTAEDRARSGVVLEIRRAAIDVVYGVVKSDVELLPDEEAADEFDEGDEDLPSVEEIIGPVDDDELDDGPQISQAEAQRLSEIRTHAVSVALSADPDLAMRVIAAALLSFDPAPANVTNTGHESVKPKARRPFSDILEYLMRAEPDVVRETLAQAVASTIDLTENAWRFRGSVAGREALARAVPGAIYLDAARSRFSPAEFFSRARSKAIALDALEEMREAGVAGIAPDDVLAGMKKSELAAAAAAVAQVCGWLPRELRHPTYALTIQAEAA